MPLLDEVNTGDAYDVRALNFPVVMLISRLDTADFVTGIHDFDYYNELGGLLLGVGPTLNSILIDYEIIENNTRQCRAGIICNRIADYEIGTTNLSQDFEDVDLTSTRCVEDILLTYSMNGDTSENNFYLLSDRTRPVVENLDGFRISGGYAFVVVE